MEPKNSRKARKEQDQTSTNYYDKNKTNKIYYIVIGGLFLILLLLIIYIFTREDNRINLGDQDESSLVQDNTPETSEGINEEMNDGETDEETISEDPEESDEETNEDDTEDSNEDSADEESESDVELGETVVVDENAPYNPSYEVNYSEGSADLAEIIETAMNSTGLDSYTQWWVEYVGPAQVMATVSNSNEAEYYNVYLQYGDGNWHATSYEQLEANPF